MEDIEYSWNELCSYVTVEQSAEVCMYFSYVAYLANYYNEQLPVYVENGNTNSMGKWRQLEQLCAYKGSTAVRAAAKDLEAGIRWTEWERDSKCMEVLERLIRILKRYVCSLERLDEVIDFFSIENIGANGGVVTPEYVKELIASLVKGRTCATILDMNSSMAGLGLSVYDKCLNNTKEGTLTHIEEWQKLCSSAKIRMFCHNICNPQVRYEHILDMPGSREKYDVVLLDLPKGTNDSILSQNVRGLEQTFDNIPPYIFSEWGYICKAVEQIRAGGRAFMVVTKGALLRKREEELRKWMIQKDWLAAVITLPEGIYRQKNISLELILIDKAKETNRKHKVFFADLHLGKQRNINLTGSMERLIEAYTTFEPLEPYMVIKDIEQIAQNGNSWNPYLYIQQEKFNRTFPKQIALGKVADITRGAQITKEEEQQLSYHATHYWINIKDIQQEMIQLDRNAKICAKTDSWREKFEIREDDIVLTSKGTELKICIVPPHFPAAFLSGNLTRIRAKKVHPYVLYEFLQSEIGRICLQSIQTGTTGAVK